MIPLYIIKVKNMGTNLLVAIANLVNNPVTDLTTANYSSNRANSMGDALETYVKDLFCGSFNEKNIQKKHEIYSEHFSYMGNTNNPPDLFIKQGDAIEIKKIERLSAPIALNSSYPKDRIYSDSPMITTDCKTCEDWQQKDLLYIIGVASGFNLKSLCFVYGDCYCASREVYEKTRNKIVFGVEQVPELEFSKTNELGRVNRVDPLGITYFRIRGMWGIENPIKVFDYIIPEETQSDFWVTAILLREKYLSFPENDRKNIEDLVSEYFSMTDVEIKSPNNPAKLLSAKLLKFRR